MMPTQWLRTSITHPSRFFEVGINSFQALTNMDSIQLKAKSSAKINSHGSTFPQFSALQAPQFLPHQMSILWVFFTRCHACKSPNSVRTCRLPSCEGLNHASPHRRFGITSLLYIIRKYLEKKHVLLTNLNIVRQYLSKCSWKPYSAKKCSWQAKVLASERHVPGYELQQESNGIP